VNQRDQPLRQRRVRVVRWLAPLAAAGLVFTMFLPWVGSGSSRRSSFETWRTADRLGVLDGPILPLLAGLWVFVPVIVGILWIATLTGRQSIALALGLFVGGVVGGGALLVLLSSARAEVGVDSAVLCSLATVAGALLAGVGRRGNT
jgi:hypothetical protein